MSFFTAILSIYLSNNSADLKTVGLENHKPLEISTADKNIEIPGNDIRRNAIDRSPENIQQDNQAKISDLKKNTSEPSLKTLTDNSQSLQKEQEGIALQNSQTNRVEHILKQLREDEDKEKAFTQLVEMKDELKGEALHSAMKAMYEFSDIGGNDILIDTFLNLTNDIPIRDRMRILSYVNPENKIKENHLLSLSDAYENTSGEEESSEIILMTISRAGGDLGAQLIIDMINPQKKDETYVQQIKALSMSESSLANDYLNQTLNELVRVNKDDQDVELIDLIRNLIQQKNPR